MRIDAITLQDFRNYEKQTVTFDPNVNIILGENAQGKTNLMEAVYLTSMAKSFRTKKDKEMIRFGADFLRVSASFSDSFSGSDTEEVDIVISKEGKKAAKIDGITVEKTSELLQHVVAIAFSPEDLKIVKEDPIKRRTFIDRELSRISLSYFETMKTYRKVLQQRNTILKGRYLDPEQEAMLDIWDKMLAQSGASLMWSRRGFVEKLSQISRRIHAGITQGKEEMELRYAPSVDFAEGVTKEILEGQLLELFEKTRAKDFESGNTSKGPHRDDISIIINGIAARNFGSQGQQRTAALSLKLAEIDIIRESMREKPILLLDDVLSELDHNRQQYMIETLKDVQLMITATDLPEDIAASLPQKKMLYVKGGSLEEKNP